MRDREKPIGTDVVLECQKVQGHVRHRDRVPARRRHPNTVRPQPSTNSCPSQTADIKNQNACQTSNQSKIVTSKVSEVGSAREREYPEGHLGEHLLDVVEVSRRQPERVVPL